MKKHETSRLIYDTLSKIKRIESPQIDVFNRQNPFSRPVYFSFRFEIGENEQIYRRLIDIVEGFEGKLKWTMYKKANRRNYIIEPDEFRLIREQYFVKNNSYINTEEEFVKIIGLKKYVDMVNKAIQDCESLSHYVEETYPR